MKCPMCEVGNIKMWSVSKDNTKTFYFECDKCYKKWN